MTSDKWLDALLQKTERIPAPAKPQLNVDSQFSNLVKVSDDGDDVARIQIRTKVYDSDPDAADVPHPADAIIAKFQRDKFRIPEPATPHADGVFFEKNETQAWEYHYESGVLRKSVLHDPQLGRMVFDAHGNEVSPSVQSDLNEIDRAWDELLSGHAGSKEMADRKKKAASSDLAKGEVSSRMLSLLANIRPDCVGSEYDQLQKAAKALDVSCFTEIVSAVIARLKRAA